MIKVNNKKQQYNNFNKIIDNKGYNYFNDEKNNIIKKRLLNNSNVNKENSQSKKNEEIFNDKQNNFNNIKNSYFNYKNSSKNSIKIKNIPINDPELQLNSTEENKEKTNINILDNINTETKNEIRTMKIKNKYLIKFGDLFDNYKKMSTNLEWIRLEYKNSFVNIINNVLKNFKEYNKLIMYKFNTKDILSLDTWSKSLKTFYDICDNIIQCQKIIIEEIINNKNNNMELHKKLRAVEDKLNSSNENIKEKNKDIIKNETNNIENKKIKETKKESINNESKYILIIYNLKKEIKDLCQELNRSRTEKNNLEEFKMKLNSVNGEIKESNKSDEENSVKNNERVIFLTQYNNELKEEINELQNEITELKNKESKYIEKITILENKCEHFNKEINEKNINIVELKNDIKKLTEVKKPQILGPINTVFVPYE